MLPELTLLIWRAVTTPLHVIAIGSTIFRLYHRYRIRQVWWDDYWAGASLFIDLIYVPAPWLRYESDDPRPPKEKRIMAYWFTAMLFPLVVWFARISIGMSIARLVPPQTRTRYLLYAMNGMFALMCAAQLLHKIVICTRNTSWHHNRAVHCYVGSGLGILSLCTDLVADACLVTVPMRMLWRVKLPRSQRRLILSIFTSSVASSFAGIIYTAFVLKSQKQSGNWVYRTGFVSSIKAAVTLLVCNLLVIVMYLYRKFWKDENDDVSEPSETRDKPTHPLPPTTILMLTEVSPARTADVHTKRVSASFVFERSAPCSLPAHIREPGRCLTF